MMPSNATAHEPAHLRTLVYEPEYTAAIQTIFKTVRRADEVLSGLELFISRRAEMGLAIKGYPADEFATWLSRLLPNGRVRVLYRYDSKEVHLIDAWMIPGYSTIP
jgi:hypothetical protein